MWMYVQSHKNAVCSSQQSLIFIYLFIYFIDIEHWFIP